MFSPLPVHNFVDNGNRGETRPVIRAQEIEDRDKTPHPVPKTDHNFPHVPWFPISSAGHGKQSAVALSRSFLIEKATSLEGN